MTVVRPPVGVCSAMAAVLGVLGTERQVKERGPALLLVWPTAFQEHRVGTSVGPKGKTGTDGGGVTQSWGAGEYAGALVLYRHRPVSYDMLWMSDLH